ASLSDGQQAFTDNLLPGTYTVTEDDPTPPFDLGAIDCNDDDSTVNVGSRTATYHLQAGETITCVFTNVKRGSVTIIKDAQPNDSQDFAFTASGAGLSGFSLDDDGDNGNTLSSTKTFTNVVPGTKSVTETDVNGWELTNLVCNGTQGSTGTRSGNTANIDLKAGGSVTCTYTNVKAGRILVDKVTNPGGDPQKFTFTPSYNGGTTFQLADQDPVNDSGDLKPGTYNVTETVPAGWDLTALACDDGDSTGDLGTATATFHVSPGETVTCTFTNTKRGHILVDKVTVPGGDPTLFTFTPSYNGGQTFQLADASPVNDSGAIVPGTYSVAETVPAGWDLTDTVCSDGSSSSAIDLAAGETVTCTFTNTKRGKIIIDKVTDPDGDPALFTFDPSYGDNFNLADETAPNDSGTLQPGTYTVVELAKAGWDLTALACNDNDSS